MAAGICFSMIKSFQLGAAGTISTLGVALRLARTPGESSPPITIILGKVLFPLTRRGTPTWRSPTPREGKKRKGRRGLKATIGRRGRPSRQDGRQERRSDT